MPKSDLGYLNQQSYSESEIPNVIAEILWVATREAGREGGGEGGGGSEGEMLRLFTSIMLSPPTMGAGKASGLGSVGG